MARKNTFYRGYVELLVLRLLYENDAYGYELTKRLKDESDGMISLSMGTLYPTLYKLIDNGFISDYKKQVGERMVRVYYHLEESGRKRFAELLEDYQAIATVLDSMLKGAEVE